jgi:hypothetical protein
MSNNNPTFLEQWTIGGIFKENGGTSDQPLKKPPVPTVLAHRQFIKIKIKHLTLLSQCKLAFTRRNVLMVLKNLRTGATLTLA